MTYRSGVALFAIRSVLTEYRQIFLATFLRSFYDHQREITPDVKDMVVEVSILSIDTKVGVM